MTVSASGQTPAWWTDRRKVAVVVDNPSWILPYAESLVSAVSEGGDYGVLCRSYEEVPKDSVAFFLGCVSIAPREVIEGCHRCLVVHASPLPKGRGFSPLTWLILEGENDIPVCLLNAGADVDSGAVIYREILRFAGHELIDELRSALGRCTVDLCRRFLAESSPPAGIEQEGEPTYYPRRRPSDSRLDPTKSLAQQFNLLRTVDNDKYPVFFDLNGHRYQLAIHKLKEDSDDS